MIEEAKKHPSPVVFSIRKNSHRQFTFDTKKDSLPTQLPRIVKLTESPQDSTNSMRQLYYTELIRQFNDKLTPKIILKQLKTKKLKENYQSIEKEQRFHQQQSRRILKAETEQKHQESSVEMTQKKIIKNANDKTHIGLQSLKNLNLSQFAHQNDTLFHRDPITSNIKVKEIICAYINKNKKFLNKEVVTIEQYEKSAPLRLEQLQFVEKVLPKCRVVEKELLYDEDNLKKNNLVLERVILERMILQ